MAEKTNEDPFDAWVDHEEIRELVHRANDLTPGERLILLKGLVPGLIDALGPVGFDEFLDELSTKAWRYEDARNHRGSGYGTRQVPGEPLGGPTPEGHLHLDEHRDPRRPGGRDAERARETDLWESRADADGDPA